ncbi:5-oxoprolinase subunit PxpB [Bacillus solitudinis]|uniref:5-oxoprolinase subunit PxpB n=1 Tax=Bacillus solitudinis TaxID=2014074 RepID=UPI000C245AE9|nr:5-oxoprolinase subunit PxpB [Bacillus solitudinis]
MRFQPLGDQAIRVQFGQDVEFRTHQDIRQFCLTLERRQVPAIIEWVPSYTAVTIYYDLSLCTYEEMKEKLQKIMKKVEGEELPPPRIVEVPTCYGDDLGPDLETVAHHNGLKPDEVIALHSEGEYIVYMLGFSPGFPYLGGLHPRLATPRLASPRAVTPAGSVGIAGEQTGIYSIETPGGWQIIGRTPLSLYDPYRKDPTLFQMGDIVKFVPISKRVYEEIKVKGYKAGGGYA